MRIIVDANIVFSAILNTNSKIADILINSKGIFDFLAPDYLQIELRKYHAKISKISNLTIIEIENIQSKITKPIFFMSGIHIPENKWILAENMVADIDPKDTPYLAFHCFTIVEFGLEIKHSEMDLKTKALKTLFLQRSYLR